MLFRILGPFEAEANGRLLALGGVKQRALLALLLLNANKVVSRDRLIEGLWGEDPPDTAATALQVYVSHLRRAVEPGGRGNDHQVLVTRAPGYMVQVEPDELDLLIFERLRREGREELAAGNARGASEKLGEALALWRGEALAELDAAPFAGIEGMRLEELRLATAEERIDAELALGHHADVVADLDSLVERNPLRERLCAQLMLALYRCGRQAAALETYQATRQRLATDLGLEPGETLKSLERAILNHDPELDAPTRASLRTRRWSRPRVLTGLTALLAAIAVAVTLISLTGGASRAAFDVAPNSVAEINPAKRTVRADIAVGAHPNAIAIGARSVWVTNADDETVSRIDPYSRKVVATIGLGTHLSDIAVGYGFVWVANGNDGTVSRIDPGLNAAQTLALGKATPLSPEPVFSVATGLGGVWVTRGNSVVKIDPVSGRVRKRIVVEAPLGITAGNGGVWVTTEVEHVLRIDPRTGAVTEDVPLSTEPIAPTIGGGSLWVILNLQPRAAIWALNPSTGATDRTVPVASTPVGLTWANGALWAVARKSILRIDATTQAVSTIAVDRQPTAVGAGDGAVWVSFASST